MIILPKVRGFMCTTAHPVGCAHNVQRQIDHVRACRPLESGPKRVLVIGSSTGYGLASRIAAAYGSGAATVGVFMEKPGSERRCGSAGWYNAAALRRSLSDAGLYARDFNGDAFSNEMKQQLVAVLAEELGPVDLVIYSLASPRRTHPVTGTLHKSVLKPIGGPITARTIDTDRRQIVEQTLEAADEDEIADTVAVMGGEDWQLWIAALADAGLLAKGCRTLAYTYIGDRITWPIYGQATIGAAKKDLDRAARELRLQLADLDGDARVAVLKAVVTQASSAIPIMPLYRRGEKRPVAAVQGHEKPRGARGLHRTDRGPDATAVWERASHCWMTAGAIAETVLNWPRRCSGRWQRPGIR